jgi:predicted AlkP superfamily pyrophosphatase or phosphodiesterase
MMRVRLPCLLLAAFIRGISTIYAAENPKLVVTIIVDQMRYDYLERAPEKFANEGFRLLIERGAFMTFARYNYFPTITGPGHASYLSGSPPSVHGIIGNEWFDKRTGKDLYCCADTNVVAVGTTNKSAMSPKNLAGATVADQMRLAFNSKVISVSMKDRGAIMPAGKRPQGAYWFESKSGNFITSTYYMTNLPAWVTAFNDRKLPASALGKSWERIREPNEYLFADDAPGEGKLHGETNSVFNHTINTSTNGFDTVYSSPFADEILTQFAIAAMDAEELGQGSQPDMLCVSYSSMDSIGHTFGPYSHEIQDETFRMDRQLELLFRHIDEKVGLANVYIVLTADHGVSPTPEFSKHMGIDAQRWDSAKFMTNLQTRLEQQFGAGKYFATMKIPYGDIFLNQDVLREKQLSLSTIAPVVREFALNTGLFMNCFTRDQLLEGRAPGQIGQFYINGYNPERGADLMLVPKPFTLAGTNKTGTTHGSVYAYDTRVPVLFFGRAFKAGRYSDEFYITDIAATLSAALHIEEPPGSIGKPCLRILADQ